MRQQKGTKTRYPGIYSLSDGTFRIVAKAVGPKTGRAKFKERYTREVEPAMTQNAAVAYRAELIDEIRLGTAAGGVPTAVPRLEMLCRSSWITFVTENVNSKERAAKLGRVVETHILRRWGAYFIDKITVPEIDAWVRTLTTSYSPETIRHHVGLFRRIVGKARGQYQLMPIDWDLITLPTVSNEHALKNRLNVEQIAAVLPIVVDQYPFYAPMIFALYTLGLRYCPRRCVAVEQARPGRGDRDRGVVRCIGERVQLGGPTQEGTADGGAGAADARAGSQAPALSEAAQPPGHRDRAAVPVRGGHTTGR